MSTLDDDFHENDALVIDEQNQGSTWPLKFAPISLHSPTQVTVSGAKMANWNEAPC